MNRIRRAWKAFRVEWARDVSEGGFYVVQETLVDRTPIGYLIVHTARSFKAALEWRREHGGSMYQVMPADDWESAAVEFARSVAYWKAWGDLMSRGRMWEDHLQAGKVSAIGALAERGPETGGLPLPSVQDTFTPGGGTPMQRALALADKRAALRPAPQSLPEGVTWDDGEHDNASG